MCIIKLEYHPEFVKAKEALDYSMIEWISETTGETIEEVTQKLQKKHKTNHKRVENDKPFVFGGVAIFAIANRYINYEVNDEAVLEWLRKDIAKLVKIEYVPVVHTKDTGYVLTIKDLVETVPLESVKVPRQSRAYKYAKRTKINKLHCLEGSIRLMLRDVPKMTRTQITLLQFVYSAVYHILFKETKNEKEQFVYDRIQMLFEEYKVLTGYTTVTTATPTWTHSISDFISRALFDPECIREFIKMETFHENSKLSTGLTVLLDTISSIAGTRNNKDKVYTCLLDTVMRVIELKENY